MLKKIIVPLLVIVLLLGLYANRWQHETTYKPSEKTQVTYKIDRWAGQRWAVTYTNYTVKEFPTGDYSPFWGGNAYAVRKTLSYTWDVLFLASLVGLIATIRKENINTRGKQL